MLKEEPILKVWSWNFLTTIETLSVVALYGLIDQKNRATGVVEGDSCMRLEDRGDVVQKRVYNWSRILGADVYLEEFYGCG